MFRMMLFALSAGSSVAFTVHAIGPHVRASEMRMSADHVPHLPGNHLQYEKHADESGASPHERWSHYEAPAGHKQHVEHLKELLSSHVKFFMGTHLQVQQKTKSENSPHERWAPLKDSRHR